MINNDLTANVGIAEVPFKFEYNSATGEYGYRDGADTFCPFKSGGSGELTTYNAAILPSDTIHSFYYGTNKLYADFNVTTKYAAIVVRIYAQQAGTGYGPPSNFDLSILSGSAKLVYTMFNNSLARQYRDVVIILLSPSDNIKIRVAYNATPTTVDASVVLDGIS
jgi:hypothetical protein